MNFRNPPPADLADFLARLQTLAVVGLSPKPDRPSHFVARAMQRLGVRIVPVRPAVSEVLGERAYGSLADIPFAVDAVDVFRAPSEVPALVEQCLQLKLPALWLQEGVVHEAAAQRARDGGVFVVMDRCIYKDYLALRTA